jgi:predicted MFS family arabinose efflux permease
MKSQENMHRQFRWIILLVAFLGYVAFAFAFQLTPPLIPSIEEEFGITHAEAGLLMSIVLIPGIFFSLPAGLVVEKYGVKKIGFLSSICVVLGCFVTATAVSFTMVLAGRFILGLGGSFIGPTNGAMIANWFKREELGKAMGIYGINMDFATILAFPIASFFAITYEWRLPFYIGLVIGISATIFFLVIAREGEIVEHERNLSTRNVLKNTEIWKVGFVWLFFSVATMSFMTWAPTLFETYRGMSNVDASFLASILMWMGMIFAPIYGWVSDRTGKRKFFAVTGSFTMMLAFIAIAFSTNLMLIVSIIALGITAAIVPPIVATLPVEILGPGLASVGFGISGICMNIGVASTQPFMGLVLDLTQSYTISLLMMAVFSAFGMLVAYSLKTK